MFLSIFSHFNISNATVTFTDKSAFKRLKGLIVVNDIQRDKSYPKGGGI